MLFTAIYTDGPVSVRYPRGKGIGTPLTNELHMLEVGKAELLSPATLEEADHTDCAILAYGTTVAQAEIAARELANEGIRAAVVNARWAKPLDEAMILRLAKSTGHIITIEDHLIAGGFGSAVLELLERHEVRNVDVRVIGLPDKFVEHGAVTLLKELHGISPAHIKEVAHQMLGSEAHTLA